MIWLEDFAVELVTATDDELKELRNMIRREQRARRKATPLKPKQKKVKLKEKDRIRNWTLYVLKLKHDKYYVGITAMTAEKRLKEHAKGSGAKWTKLHEPIGIIDYYKIGTMPESKAVEIESNKTVELMVEHGVENVRGGGLCQVELRHVRKSFERRKKKLML